jgi:hypothetical protein
MSVWQMVTARPERANGFTVRRPASELGDALKEAGADSAEFIAHAALFLSIRPSADSSSSNDSPGVFMHSGNVRCSVLQ